MDQKKDVSFPMTDIKRPPDPYAPGYSSSYTPESYASEPQFKKSHAKQPQASKSSVPQPKTSKSYAPGLYEPKSHTPDLYAPKSYSSDPYGPKSYSSDPYGPESYSSDPYGPESYSSDPYGPKSYSSDPYGPKSYSSNPCGPEPSAPNYVEYSDDCSYTIEVLPGDCPSPPPYEEVQCNKIVTARGCCTLNQPPVVVAGIFSAEPASTICPCCRQIITTEVVFRVGSLTYALCCCLCVVGCCLGCCLIPFASKCCKDVDHYCPCCRYHIYRYKRL